MVRALEKFRQKYPEYNNRSDEELASALAKKYPEYGTLVEAVARDKAVSGYEPMTRESAQMAMDRPSMWKALGEEVAYAPWENPNLKPMQKARQTLLHGPAMAMKGLGAVGQSVEGLISSLPVAWQRGLRPTGKTADEYWRTVGKSATGEEPTEYGDVIRNFGAPEWMARAGGLAASAITPGIKQMAKAPGAARKFAEKWVEKGTTATGKFSARAILALARRNPEAAEIGFKTGFKGISMNMPKEVIERNVTNASTRLNRVSKIMTRKISNEFEGALDKHNDEIVKLILPSGESAVTSNAKNNLVREGLIALNKKGKYVATEKGLNGLDVVIQKINALDNLGESSVRSLRAAKRLLRGVTKSEASDSAAKAAAWRILDDIDDNIGAQVKGMKEMNAKYKYWNGRYGLNTTADKLAKSTEEVTKKSRTENYFKLARAEKDFLARYDKELVTSGGKHLKFLDRMQKAALQNEYKEFRPASMLSLAGAGAIGGGAIALHNPAMAAGVVGAGLMTSPRIAGTVQRRLSSISRFRTSPGAQRIRDLVGRGLIDPALLQGARKRQLYPSMKEE